jgi:hypothetical protein
MWCGWGQPKPEDNAVIILCHASYLNLLVVLGLFWQLSNYLNRFCKIKQFLLSKKKRFKRRIIQPVFGVKMINKAQRKSILVEEAVFYDFKQKREILGLNSSETLQALLQAEITRTETTMVNRIEPIGDFDYEAKKMTKKGDD